MIKKCLTLAAMLFGGGLIYVGAKTWWPQAARQINEGVVAVEGLGDVPVISHSKPDKGQLIIFAAAEETAEQRLRLARRWAEKGYATSLVAPELPVGEGACTDLTVPLERLRHGVEEQFPSVKGLAPLLLGYKGGATRAFVALAQAPLKTFHSAIGLDFCPSKPPQAYCSKRAWRDQGGFTEVHTQPLGANFYAFQLPSEETNSCDRAAAEAFFAQNASVKLSQAQGGADQWLEVDALLNWLDPRLSDQALSGQGDSASPIIEVPAEGPPADYFVVLLTGDGGWAKLDKELARHFSAQGVAVLGFDSLSYFWRKRTPEETAARISGLITQYREKWQKQQVVLVGYSFGADVLPYVVAHMPKQQQAIVKHMVLLGLSRFAHFEFYLTNWLSSATRQSPFATVNALTTIQTIPGLCVQGALDTESICNQLQQPNLKSVMLPGDHHYDEDYETLSQVIMSVLRRPAASE